MHTFNVSVNAIRAARTHTAEKDIRHHLQGVHFDLDAGRIVSTDGHRMFVSAGPVAYGAGTFIMPNMLIDNVLKAVGKKYLYDEVEVTYDAGNIQIKTTNGTFSSGAVDGKFPDWRRVIPQTVTGEVAQFNSQYLADAQEALAIYQGFKPLNLIFKVAHNGNSPAVCTTGDDSVLVIVMPLRADTTAAARAATELATWAVSMANAEAARVNMAGAA